MKQFIILHVASQVDIAAVACWRGTLSLRFFHHTVCFFSFDSKSNSDRMNFKIVSGRSLKTVFCLFVLIFENIILSLLLQI